ncbi:MAG: TonB-dependent receptor [Labilithrix sp.]|nr:TonB-dependent receptor [Labilithrix sp.]
MRRPVCPRWSLALLLAFASAAGTTLMGARPALAHDVVQPRPKTQPPAAWPTGRPEAHDVVVPVVLVVGEDGKVTSAEVEASVRPDFDRAAVAAARTWTFEPAIRDGKAVAAKIRSVVRFAGVSGAAEGQAPSATRPPPAAIAPSAPPAAAAAGASAPESPDPGASPHARDVRVTGTAPPRSASEVVRGRDVIMAAPHRTASDALAVVPGVFVTQHSGEGKAHQIFLRGFDAVHGQDLELWVGGVPVNEVSNVHGQGYADLHFVMPEVIREVQATPGSFDPKQGDFAVAGSIRMKLGYAEPGATVKGTVGSFGVKRLFLAYHPKDATDETFAAGEVYSTDGFGPNRAARRASMIAQGTHDFDGGLALRVLASTYAGRYDSAGVVPAADIESGRLDRFATLDPKQGGYSTRNQLLLELHRDDDHGRWTIAPFVVFRTLQLRQNFTGWFLDTQRSGADRLESDNTQQLNESVTAGATASYRKGVELLSARDAVEIGVYGRHDVIEQSQRRLSDVNDVPTQTLVDAAVRGTNIAAYADAALHPFSRLAVRGGLRVDGLSYAAQDRVNAQGAPGAAQARAAQGAHLGKKLTVDYGLLPRTHLVASYGDGFRSPQARGLSNGERTFLTEVSSYELGLRYADGARLAGSVAGFYTDLSEDLVFDPATARNERVPGTARKGIAAEMTARANDLLLLSSSATYTHAAFTGQNTQYGKGDLLPYVPQLVLRTDAAVTKKLGRVLERDLEGRLGAGLEGLIGRPLPFDELGRHVFLVDASAAVRLKEIELGLDVFNLLDASWYDGQFVYASNFSRAASPARVPFRHVTVGPPRTFFFSLTLHV